MSAVEEYRMKIRETDKQLLSIVRERFSLARRIAQAKQSEGIPTIDSDAERITIENLTQVADQIGVPAQFARRLGELLIEEAVRVQEETRPKQSKDLLLKQIFERTQQLLSRGVRVTRLEIGEPNFPASPRIIRGLTDTFRKKKVIGYGPAAGLPELRKVLAEEISAQHNVTIDPDQILIMPGGRFAIFATVASFVADLERVVIPQPAWPAYEECVDFVKGRPIPLNTRLEDEWEIDLNSLEEELKKGVKMLIVNTPNNPTGKSIGRKKFEEIVELAEKYDTLVLSDEVYDKYTRTKTPSILESEKENFVYINSYSKQFSLTGWRVAYLVTTKEKALRIRRVIQTAVTCVPEFIQNAAIIAIKKCKAEAQVQVDHILDKVELTCQELRRINVSFYKPDGAFYIFPRANKKNFDSVRFAQQLLEHEHISIGPGQAFGEYPAFFRLSVSLPKAQIPGAVRAIGKAIDAWQ